MPHVFKVHALLSSLPGLLGLTLQAPDCVMQSRQDKPGNSSAPEVADSAALYTAGYRPVILLGLLCREVHRFGKRCHSPHVVAATRHRRCTAAPNAAATRQRRCATRSQPTLLHWPASPLCPLPRRRHARCCCSAGACPAWRRCSSPTLPPAPRSPSSSLSSSPPPPQSSAPPQTSMSES